MLVIVGRVLCWVARFDDRYLSVGVTLFGILLFVVVMFFGVSLIERGGYFFCIGFRIWE